MTLRRAKQLKQLIRLPVEWFTLSHQQWKPGDKDFTQDIFPTVVTVNASLIKALFGDMFHKSKVNSHSNADIHVNFLIENAITGAYLQAIGKWLLAAYCFGYCYGIRFYNFSLVESY